MLSGGIVFLIFSVVSGFCIAHCWSLVDKFLGMWDTLQSSYQEVSSLATPAPSFPLALVLVSTQNHMLDVTAADSLYIHYVKWKLPHTVCNYKQLYSLAVEWFWFGNLLVIWCDKDINDHKLQVKVIILIYFAIRAFFFLQDHTLPENTQMLMHLFKVIQLSLINNQKLQMLRQFFLVHVNHQARVAKTKNTPTIVC